ncbi:MAG: DUF3791 domain-containing protein [Propionibacteriaceae bacterium]|jgi:hypothetical protein|nr:DUF3791 domain-containing protein [Propionibacteriaceae bacterium]
MYANKLPPETEFFLFLLEHYARHHDIGAAQALARWDAADLTPYVRDNYERYHQEALTNAFADIDRQLAETAGRQRPDD